MVSQQGCSLSPLLYIIYDEVMMKEATENVQEGISVAGATVSLIRYADDKDAVASSQRGLQYLVEDSITHTHTHTQPTNLD